MDRIARHAKDLLGSDTSAIFLPERKKDGGPPAFRAIVVEGADAPQIKDLKVVSGIGIIGAIIASGRAECVNDVDHDPRAVPVEGTEQASDERLMVAPLRAGKAVKGAMAVWRTAGDPFRQHELEFLVGLSLAAAVAMENARLFAQAEQRAAELDTVNTVSQQVAGKLDIAGLIELVGEQVRRVFKPDIAYVALDRPRDANDPLSLPARRRDGRATTWRGTYEPDHRLRHAAAAQQRREPQRRCGCQAPGQARALVLGVPIVVDGRAEGVISVQSTQREGVYDANDQRLLETIAASVGVALRNAQLFAETQEARAAAEAANQAKSALPRDDEPRDPHADERRDRHERAAARHAAQRRAARLRRDDPRLGRRAADDHQRHPRLLEDRGRPDGHRGAAVRPARVRRVGARPRRARAPRRSGSTLAYLFEGDVPAAVGAT